MRAAVKNCPTCRQKLPGFVTDFWKKTRLAGHAARCKCNFCKGDVAAVVAELIAYEAKKAQPSKSERRQLGLTAAVATTSRRLDVWRKAAKRATDWPVQPKGKPNVQR